MHMWRDRLSRWLTPIAQRTPLAPNTVTIAALLLNLVACGLFLLAPESPWLFLLADVFIAAGGLADALDGIVARVQRKETRFGDFLDHVCDRVSDTALAACWMIGNGVRESLLVVAVVAIMLNGYIGTQIETTYRERNYDSVGRGEFVLAIIVFPIVSFILFATGWNTRAFAGLTVAGWLSAALIAFALVGILQRVALAWRLERS